MCLSRALEWREGSFCRGAMASKEKPTSFADLMAAIDAAANNYAIQQAGAEIQKSSGTLSPQQIAALASAFKERAKYLRDGAVRLMPCGYKAACRTGRRLH